jgi:hypothetical protein
MHTWLIIPSGRKTPTRMQTPAPLLHFHQGGRLGRLSRGDSQGTRRLPGPGSDQGGAPAARERRPRLSHRSMRHCWLPREGARDPKGLDDANACEITLLLPPLLLLCKVQCIPPQSDRHEFAHTTSLVYTRFGTVPVEMPAVEAGSI